MNKKPDGGPAAFDHGTTTSPAPKLLAWLDGQKGKKLRVPVILSAGMTGWKTRGAKLGSAADAPEIYCNDAPLGIGLSMRVTKLCGPAAQGKTCAVWLVGTWRGKVDDSYQLDVTNVGDAIADAATANHVEIEATGN